MTGHTLPVGELRPGDYVVPARATVRAVDQFAGLAIVEFTDGTATAPLPQAMTVEITKRLPTGEQSSAVISTHQPCTP